MSFYLKIDYLYLGLFFHYPLGLLSIDNLFFLFSVLFQHPRFVLSTRFSYDLT